MDLNKNVREDIVEGITGHFKDFYPIVLETVEYNSIDSLNKISNIMVDTINDSIDNYYNPDNLF